MLEVRFWTVNITESRSYSKFEFRTSKNHMLALQYRLNVDYRGAVDGLNRADSQSLPRDSVNGHRVQAERVGAVGRSGGEDPGKRTVRIGTGMNFQYLAVSLMKPGYEDYLVTRLKAVESLSRERMHLNPRVRSALRALHRGFHNISQAGPDYADGTKHKFSRHQ
jgi:hypothetical protein